MSPGNQLDGDPFDLRAHFRIVRCFAGNVTSAEVTSAYNLRRNLCRCGEGPSNINGLTVQCHRTLLRPCITTMNEPKIRQRHAVSAEDTRTSRVALALAGRLSSQEIEEEEKGFCDVLLRLRHKNWTVLFLR